jgi:hypothetical protein
MPIPGTGGIIIGPSEVGISTHIIIAITIAVGKLQGRLACVWAWCIGAIQEYRNASMVAAQESFLIL